MCLNTSAGKIACLIFIFYLTISCNPEKSINEPFKDGSGLMAISGMDKINDSTYLAVYDLKSFEEGNRMGVIEVSEDEGLRIYPVTVTNWQHEDGKGSDLESICNLPNRGNEFLIAESGKWDGKYGRMFHIQLNYKSGNYRVKVMGVFDIPEFDAKGPEDSAGDEIEGLTCLLTDTNEYLVLFGERGGSEAYKEGLIRWARADLDTYDLIWNENGMSGKRVNAPGSWKNSNLNRDISGLYSDADNKLWAVASEELGEMGPFNSIVYQIGEVRNTMEDPILVRDTLTVHKMITGFKAEGISAGTGLLPGSVFAIGTEDELLGGSWRVLN